MDIFPPSPDKPKQWDFDPETLGRAWLAWQRIPVADKHERFGQWFWNRFKMRGMISWPALFYEESPLKAYTMLAELAYTVKGEEKVRRNTDER